MNDETPEQRRERRKAALDACFGMWKGRTDIPLDGVEYQRMMREEWEKDNPLYEMRSLLREIIYGGSDEKAARLARSALDISYKLEEK